MGLAKDKGGGALPVVKAEKRGFVGRLVFQYNVTFGLYMLDTWEKALFNSCVLFGTATTMYYMASWVGAV
eukprot:g758.t1